MKTNIILITLITLAIFTTNLNAAPVGSSFSYQGELVDNGTPANGDYDIKIEAYSKETDGALLATHLADITLANGLFNVPDVAFGDAIYDGAEIWLEVSIKPVGTATYTLLTPRQRLNAVPYAVQSEFLAPNGANTNDVLQFDGSNWVGVALSTTTPWSMSGSDISFSSGKVGIGTGLNQLNNSLEIRGQFGVDPFVIQTSGGFDTFRVAQNSGVVIGFASSPPDGGLQVQGNVRQGPITNGIMKYMIEANCGTNPSIINYYNGVGDGLGGAPVISTFNSSDGQCRIITPIDISDRYIQASAFQDFQSGTINPTSLGVTCGRTNSQGYLYCKRFNGIGTGVNGRIMILVY